MSRSITSKTSPMLASIKNFFQTHLAADSHSNESAEHRARLAAAALLIEVTRADEQFSDKERETLLASLETKFGLPPDEARELIKLAEEEVHDATDLYQFTSQINSAFSVQQKVKLIEHLWRVAYADKTLHQREEYVIRRIADLIHLPHGAFITAKLRVQNASL